MVGSSINERALHHLTLEVPDNFFHLNRIKSSFCKREKMRKWETEEKGKINEKGDWLKNRKERSKK